PSTRPSVFHHQAGIIDVMLCSYQSSNRLEREEILHRYPESRSGIWHIQQGGVVGGSQVRADRSAVLFLWSGSRRKRSTVSPGIFIPGISLLKISKSVDRASMQGRASFRHNGNRGKRGLYVSRSLVP